MNNRRFILMVIVICLTLYALSGRAQEPSPSPSPSPSPQEQEWKVVADIDPVHLEDELKRLNALGYVIKRSNLYVVGSKFTIVLNVDDVGGSEDDEEDAGR